MIMIILACIGIVILVFVWVSAGRSDELDRAISQYIGEAKLDRRRSPRCARCRSPLAETSHGICCTSEGTEVEHNEMLGHWMLGHFFQRDWPRYRDDPCFHDPQYINDPRACFRLSLLEPLHPSMGRWQDVRCNCECHASANAAIDDGIRAQ